MKKIIGYTFSLCALLLLHTKPLQAQTMDGEIVRMLTGAAIAPNVQLPQLTDGVYEDLDLRTKIKKTQRYNNTVSLVLNDKSLTVIPVSSFSYKVKVDIISHDINNNILDNITGKELEITYNDAAGAKYDAIQYVRLSPLAEKIQVTVKQVTLSTSNNSVLPFIRLEARMQAVRDYHFACGSIISGLTNNPVAAWGTIPNFTGNVTTSSNIVSNIPTEFLSGAEPLLKAGQTITGDGIAPNTTITNTSGTTITLSSNATANINDAELTIANDDEAEIKWDAIEHTEGVTHYDIEWAWVDKDAQDQYKETVSSTLVFSAEKVFNNNAGRVTIANDAEHGIPGTNYRHYKIPLLYDGEGFLFYRVRPVQYTNDGTVLNGEWSTIAPANQWYFSFTGHQNNMNWQAVTTYAEEGKHKTVVQYFDGTLRNRQTVTKDNTSNTTVVAETLYDYQGRPAIQILPSPTLNKTIQYAQNFNRFQGFDRLQNPKEIYDMVSGGINARICGDLPSQLLSSSGAAQYYSPDNPKAADGENQFIPDANGYPYAETRYSQDATGRVVAQGGVGPQFQINSASSHQTEYFYGSPTQKELDALFGTEVGYASHYFKNMVKDANGQYSVSYVDMAGRTIATALAGDNPANVAALPSLTALSGSNNITENLITPQNNIVTDRSVISTSTLLVPASGVYTFNYSLSPESFEILACNNKAEGDGDGEESLNPHVCYDCLYDLEITITPPCTNDTRVQPYHGEWKNFSLNSSGKIDPLDINCTNSAAGFSPNIPPYFVVPGEYTITKKLTLSSKGQIQYKEDVFTPRNTCKSLKTFYDEIYAAMISESVCNLDCQACSTALGSETQFRENFLIAIGLSPTGVISPEIEATIKASYSENKASCDLLCDAKADKTEILKEQMIADMTPPNGQYAKLDRLIPATPETPEHIEFYTSEPYNIFKTDLVLNLPPTGSPFEPEPGVTVLEGPYRKPVLEQVFRNPAHPDYAYGNYYFNDIGLKDPNAYNNANGFYGYQDLKYTTPESFAANFNHSWGSSLLYYHPEYKRFKLLNTPPLLGSGKDDIDLENISTYAQAEALGYMNAGFTWETDVIPNVKRFHSVLLQSDKFFNSVSGAQYKELMYQAMEENYFPVSAMFLPPGQTPGQPLSMWQIAWARLNCNQNDAACIFNNYKVPSAFPANSCTGDKDAMWVMFRTMYLNLKREFVMKYLESAAPTPGFDQDIQTYNYVRRIGSFSSFQKDNSFLNALNGTTAANGQVPPAIVDKTKEFYENNCEGYKQQWLQELETCLQQSQYTEVQRQAVKDQLLPLLKNICVFGSDDQHPFGSSSLSDTDPRDPNSFELAIKQVFTANSISIDALCHPFLITYPKPYYKQAAPSDGVLVTQDDKCLCDKLQKLKSEKANMGYTGSLHGFILYQHGVDIRPTLLDSLVSRCDGNPTCTTFDKPVTIPGFLTCFGTVENTCISCQQYNNLVTRFHAEMPMLSADAPFAEPLLNTNQLAQNEAFAAFMNSQTGFTKSWVDYIAFKQECGNYINIYNCTYLTSLVTNYNNQPHPPFESVEDCRITFVNYFNQQTGKNYNWDQIVFVFISTCGTPPDICNLEIPCEDLSNIAREFRLSYYPPNGIVVDKPGNCKQAFLDYFNQHYHTNLIWEELEKLYTDCRLKLDVCDIMNCADIKWIVQQFKNTQPWIYPDCKERWVNFFNSFYGTSYNYEEIAKICLGCVKTLNICNPTVDCEKLEAYVSQYKNGMYDCPSLEPKGSPEYCRECFTSFMNQKMGTSYTYEQLMLLLHNVCGWDIVSLCENIFSCETITEFSANFIRDYDPNSTTCRADFVAAFNIKFKTNYNYDQIMAVYLLYCKEMPSPCNTVTADCKKLAEIYGNFTAVFREKFPSEDPGTGGEPSMCQQAFIEAVNSALGSQYTTFEQILDLYKQCPEINLVLCDSRCCTPKINFLNNFIAEYGSYQWPQQLKIDLFIKLYNEAGAADNSPFAVCWEKLEKWSQVMDVYNTCGAGEELELAIPADNGPLLECDRLNGIELAFTGLLPLPFPENCEQYATDWFNHYFQQGMDYADIVKWITETCNKIIPLCGGEIVRKVTIPAARVLRPGIGTVPQVMPPMPPMLCGLNTPVFPSVKEEPVPCSEIRQMALNAATEQYNLYVQDLQDGFDLQYQNKCLAAAKLEHFSVTHAPAEYHYTLYYYDQAGNLVKTVPPAGVHPNFADVDLVNAVRNGETVTIQPVPPAHTLATEYRYNSLNQVIMQKTPDAGTSFFWYDRLGRLVLSQNAKQHNQSRYSYTLYDELGRIKEVGQVSQANLALEQLQVIAQNGDANDPALEGTTGTLANWLMHKNAQEITRTKYDEGYDNILLPAGFVQQNLRNRVSYTMLAPTGTAGDMPGSPSHSAATFYTYDIHGNVDELLQDFGVNAVYPNAMNVSNRFKKIQYDYDLVSGKVNEVAYQAGAVDAFYHRYQYDAENRITNVETSRDEIVWQQDAAYKYYRHGPLARTVLGNGVQGLDYAYTLQGWLKGINSTSVDNGDFDMGKDGTGNSLVARDAFGFSLNYFGADYRTINSTATPFADITTLPAGGKDLFNGNISSMVVNIPTLEVIGENGAKVYGFGYDQLDRLLQVDVFEGLNNITNIFTPVTINNQYQEKLKYDANGNILEYKRNGNGSIVFLNNYEYNYTPGTNRLASINKRDAADVTILNKSYSYDEIGNTTADEMQGVTNAVWNMQGKLQSCTNKNGQPIVYTYNATGQRISKTSAGVTEYYVRDAGGNIMATYKKGVTINGNHLTAVAFDKYGSTYLGTAKINIDVELVVSSSITTVTKGATEYIITDHRGNNMMAVSDRNIALDNDQNGVIDYYAADVLTASYYSAYGAISKSFNGSDIDKAHNKQKRSVEIGEFAQTALYWEYNGDIGRRMNLDPVINPSFSPYACFDDNPILLIDVLGNEAFGPPGHKKPKAKTKNKAKKVERKPDPTAGGIPIFAEEILFPNVQKVDIEYSKTPQGAPHTLVFVGGLRFLLLSREASTDQIEKNRDASKKANRYDKNPNSKIYDMHECAYACTKEGGATSIRRPVGREENQNHGRALRWFFKRNNVKDGGLFLVPLDDKEKFNRQFATQTQTEAETKQAKSPSAIQSPEAQPVIVIPNDRTLPQAVQRQQPQPEVPSISLWQIIRMTPMAICIQAAINTIKFDPSINRSDQYIDWQ